MTDRRVPGRAPILFTSAASETVKAFSSHEKGELASALTRLSDRGPLPGRSSPQDWQSRISASPSWGQPTRHLQTSDGR